MTLPKDAPAWAFKSSIFPINTLPFYLCGAVAGTRSTTQHLSLKRRRSVTGLSSLKHEITGSSREATLPFITVVYPCARAPTGSRDEKWWEVERLRPSREQTRQGFGLQPEQEMEPSPSGGLFITRRRVRYSSGGGNCFDSLSS